MVVIMTIKQLEQELEIPRATIRFYEKERLIAPKRSDNSYREYSDEDVAVLKKVIILRKIGLSVADIKMVLDGGPLQFSRMRMKTVIRSGYRPCWIL